MRDLFRIVLLSAIVIASGLATETDIKKENIVKTQQELYTKLDTLEVPAPKMYAQTDLPRVRIGEPARTSEVEVDIQKAQTTLPRVRIAQPDTAELNAPARQRVQTSDVDVRFQKVDTNMADIRIQGANTTMPAINLGKAPVTQMADITIEKARTQLLNAPERQRVQTADFDV